MGCHNNWLNIISKVLSTFEINFGFYKKREKNFKILCNSYGKINLIVPSSFEINFRIKKKCHLVF